jgi:stearoyl-CoA desaturase (Delta-9 desaturase)
MEKAQNLKTRYLLPANKFKSEQRSHFAWSVLLPGLLTLAGAFTLPTQAFTWQAAVLGLFMWWVVGCLGVSVGFHRLFAHRSFTVSPRVRYWLGGFGQMAVQGSVIYWTSLHRCHHTLSDQEGDPHSPAQSSRPGKSAWRALWIGHMGWTVSHDVPKPTRFATELLADATAKKLSQQYWLWVAAGWLFPACLGAVVLQPDDLASLEGAFIGALAGAWWGGALRISLGHHIIWSINSICHRFGSRPHATTDTSVNNAWLSLLSWGESWHNNHHNNATSARLGTAWWQVDVGWYCIAVLRSLGAASNVRL